MKRLFYILCVVVLNSAFASDITGLADLYDLYNKKEYKQVHKKTKAYLKQNPLSLDGNLLLGNCAYKLGNYDEAMAAYDRVLILEPEHTYAKFQEAKIYIKSKQENMAKLELDALLAKKLTKKQRSNILKLRDSIKNTSPKKAIAKSSDFNGEVGLGLMYDTNPSANIGEKSFVLPAYSIEYNGTKQENDFAHYENLYLQINRDMYKSFGLLASFNAYNKSYFDLDENDFSYLLFNLSPYYNAGDYKIFLPLVFNKVFLDHSSYLNTFGGGITVKKSINKGLVEAGYKYLENRYYGEDQSKDSRYQNIYLGLRYILFDDMLAYMYAKYTHNREKEDLRTDINYNSLGFDIGARKEIFMNLIARAKFSFNSYKYKDINRVFLNKRDDDIYSYSLGLSYNINSASSVDFDVKLLDKRSNQFLYEYDRIMTMLGYRYKF